MSRLSTPPVTVAEIAVAIEFGISDGGGGGGGAADDGVISSDAPVLLSELSEV